MKKTSLSANAFRSWLCLDCNKLVGELYMVHNGLWEQAVPPPHQKRMLHLACLSARIGRPITVEDLSDAKCNDGYRWFAGAAR